MKNILFLFRFYEFVPYKAIFLQLLLQLLLLQVFHFLQPIYHFPFELYHLFINLRIISSRIQLLTLFLQLHLRVQLENLGTLKCKHTCVVKRRISSYIII